MTLVVVPVFLWARRLMKPLYAVMTAAVVLMMPSFVYTGTLMTENAFFPVFILSLFAFALAIERPSTVNQVLALASVALAFAVRQQAAVLVPTLVGALVLKSMLDLRADGLPLRIRPLLRRARAYSVTWIGLALAIVSYVVYTRVRGDGLGSALGAYSAASSADYSFRDALRWIAYHVGELTLTSAVLPTMAFVIVLSCVWFKADVTRPAQRAFAAVALPAYVLLVVQVGIFASRWSLRIEERNMFYIVPVLLIGLAMWLTGTTVRPTRTTAVATALAAVVIFVPPYEQLLGSGLVNDTLGLLPMLDAVLKLDGGLNDVRILMAVGALAAVALFTLAPRRVLRVVAPCAVGAFLITSSIGVFDDVRRVSVAYRSAPSVGADANWVDRAVGADQDVLLLGAATESFSDLQKLRWHTEFFNRSVDDTVVLDSGALIDPATGFVTGPGPDGQPLESRHVLTDSGVILAGRVVADRAPFRLYEFRGQVRVQALTTGVSTDGWTGEEAALNVYAAPGESASASVSIGLTGWAGPDVPASVTIRAGTFGICEDGAPAIDRVIEESTVELHTGEQQTIPLSAQTDSLRVEILVDRTFSPADFGFGDTRQLGVQFGYAIG